MAMPQLRTEGWTLEEMHRLPDDGNRYELVHGTLLVTPAPRFAHQSIVAVLSRMLDRYAEAQKLGRVHTARSVISIHGSETEPDLMVRPDPATFPVEWDDAPLPSLVVEVLSESSRHGDQVVKRALYLEIGVPEYWLVDCDHRTIRVVRRGSEDVVVGDTVVWHPAGAGVALTVDVAAIFREALGSQ